MKFLCTASDLSYPGEGKEGKEGSNPTCSSLLLDFFQKEGRYLVFQSRSEDI